MGLILYTYMGNSMVKKEDISELEAWEDYKKVLKQGIDEAIERGKVDRDVLYIMKELLDDGIIRPKKKTIEEYFEEQ